MASKKLKVGIIGTGQIGKHHIAGYKNIPDAEMVAVADLNEAEAKRVAAEYGIPHVFTDYHDLLAMDEIDSVDVCLHNFLHCPVTCDALEAGKHVYCEKPFATSAAEARKMVDTASKVGKRVSMQLGTLFSPEAQCAKELINKGVLGNIYYAKTSNYRRRGRPFVDGYGTANFVQKDKAGGGTINDMGVYHLGLMMWLLDTPKLKSVSGATFQELDMDKKRRKISGYNVEETAVGLVHFEGGLTLFFEESWAIHAEGGDGDRIYGSKAGMKLSPLTVCTNIGGVESNAAIQVGVWDGRMGLMDENHQAYRNQQTHLVWGLLGRIPMIDTGQIGLRVAEITEALYKDAEMR